jgi:uncharacterized protein (DUF1697 family)
MAERSIALVRGINVGRHKRIAMADLRELVKSLGYGDVATFLQSGNVVFATPDAASGGAIAAGRIRDAIHRRLGVAAGVIVIGSGELAAAIDADPFATHGFDPARYLLGVLESTADAERFAPLLAREWGDDRLAVRGRFAYLACPNGIHTSKLFTITDRTLRDACTTRNWSTAKSVLALSRK